MKLGMLYYLCTKLLLCSVYNQLSSSLGDWKQNYIQESETHFFFPVSVKPGAYERGLGGPDLPSPVSSLEA